MIVFPVLMALFSLSQPARNVPTFAKHVSHIISVLPVH